MSIKITSGNLETYEALLLQLDDPASVSSVDRVELVFGDVTQIFPTAFALMAAFVAQARGPDSRPLVSRKFGANPQSAKLERMMDAIGFVDVVAGREAKRRPTSGVIPLTAITQDTSATDVAEQVLDIVTETAQPTRDAKETIFVLVSELVDNVKRHAKAEQPPMICGQLSAQKRKLELCLVDTGVGVKESFLNGKNEDAKKRIAAGESALSLALEPGVSQVGGISNGLGYFVASEAARQTRGIFRLTSGNETVIVSKEGEKHRTHAPWHGTVANLMLNINRVGSIAETYRELPLMRGENERIVRT